MAVVIDQFEVVPTTEPPAVDRAAQPPPPPPLAAAARAAREIERVTRLAAARDARLDVR